VGNPSGRKQNYPFSYEGRIVRIDVEDGLQVADVKPLVAQRFGAKPEGVTLLHLGKVLQDNLRFDKLRIQEESPVFVHIRPSDEILLLSQPGIGRNRDISSIRSFDRLVTSLVNITGATRSCCEWTLTEYGDFTTALQALRQ
jgi:hypothetical protein